MAARHWPLGQLRRLHGSRARAELAPKLSRDDISGDSEDADYVNHQEHIRRLKDHTRRQP